MTDASFSQNRLTIDGEEYELDSEILKAVVVDDKVVVHIVSETNSGIKDHRNIKCFDEDGEKKWDIEKPERKPANGTPIFMDVTIEDGAIFGYHRNTYKYEIDLQDGSITEVKKAGK